jgi:L-glyceraldehyde 3-phosphate reductase
MPSNNRYQHMQYNRCGNSGIKLPAISLGLWHNFGDVDEPRNFRDILLTAFDSGITHFDLANNYGPPPGSAESNFGKLLATDLKAHRDELIISTKAGYTMWDGPYGDWGSKKYLVSSLDQSLKRMGLAYVDIFYHHRPDPETPLAETMATLALMVRQGKALYIGISNYGAAEAAEAIQMLNEMGTPCLIHQPKYSMFERTPQSGLLSLLEKENVGCIPFSPLAQGMLTDKYLNGIPANSRAAKATGFLQTTAITQERLDQILKLDQIAVSRNQTLAQMALAWVLRQQAVTSVLVGASSAAQLTDSIQSLNNLSFAAEELSQIENILNS